MNEVEDENSRLRKKIAVYERAICDSQARLTGIAHCLTDDLTKYFKKKSGEDAAESSSA